MIFCTGPRPTCLSYLRINNIALITSPGGRARARPDPAHGRDRRGKVDTDRRPGPAPGRARLGGAHPHGRGAGGGRGGLRGAGRARGLLESHGIPAEDDEVVIRREIQASGKGQGVGERRPRSGRHPEGPRAPRLAVIHGQHEPQGLLDPDRTSSCSTHFAGEPTTARPLGRVLPATFGRPRPPSKRLRRDRREGERRREMLEFQAERDREGRARGGRGGGAARREGAPGQRGPPRRPERRGLRAPLRRRGGGALAPGPGLPAGRGARRHRLLRFAALPRGAGGGVGAARGPGPASCATTRSSSRSAPGASTRSRRASRSSSG